MFESWKRTWQETVDSFWRELRRQEGVPLGDARLRAMHRDVSNAADDLRRLESELARSRRAAAKEREEVAVCRRREALARNIDDEETARVAADFAARHEERAALLERKIEVLEAELELHMRELTAMEAALQEQLQLAGETEIAGVHGSAATAAPPAAEVDDAEFRRLEREAREKAADAKLEELKRRMGR